MKKLFPLALLGAAVAAAAYVIDRNNKQHVDKTIEALDEISRNAEETVAALSEEIIEDEEA